MVRTKTPVGLIKDARKRRQSFANRRRGLLLGSRDGKRLSKAHELATLCGVPVAVVCADLDGGAPTVVETEPGVLDRYRALPAEKRAEHTHVGYLAGLIGKEKAKLARVRQAGPAALATPHLAMSTMTAEELRGLLQSVDAALAATAERRRALGMPGDDDDAVVVPRRGGDPEGGDGRYFDPIQQLGQRDTGLLLDQAMFWRGSQAHGGGGGMIPREYCYGGMKNVQPAYDPQPQYTICNPAVRGYQQQMPRSNGGYYLEPLPPAASIFQPRNVIAQPWNGTFQYDDGGSSGHVGTSSSWAPSNGNFSNGHVGTSSSWTPSNGNFSNGAVVQDLSIWSAAESSNAITTGYPYMHTGGNAAAAEYPDQFTSSNFSDAPAGFLNMGGAGGIGGMNYLGGYETQGSSNNLQAQGSSNNLQYSGASQNSSSVEEQQFGYGRDY
uniref:Uncharacterized protein n=1 Tax=Avena sativa TaxID=4498 RepID=A0ACD5WJY8_AVESA